MEDLINMVVSDASPSDISAQIKDALFAKAGEKIEALRPEVATTLFSMNGVDSEQEEE
jgi:hypothetical protein